MAMGYASASVRTNSIAIKTGRNAAAPVSGTPFTIRSANSIGSESRKWTRLLATLTTGKITAGTPGRRTSSRFPTTDVVAKFSEVWNHPYTRSPVKRYAEKFRYRLAAPCQK